MRYFLVLLLALAPFGAPQAAVSVTGTMSCTNASSITYSLDLNRMSFFCNTDAKTYSCTPDSVDYGTGTQVISMTCVNNTTSVLGLVVNATVDGVQNGNGNNDGFCNNANNFNFDLAKGKYTWDCDNGGGNNKSVACFTSQELSNFDLSANQMNMDCVTLFSRSSFEEFEPAPEAQ